MRTRMLPVLLGLLFLSSEARAQRWDASGWVLLGETQVRGRRGEHERIDVGREAGRFTKVMVVVENAEVELLGFMVTFRRGEPFRPDLRYRFRPGSSTAPIDLPGEARVIQSIEFDARDTPRRGRATVQVWGQAASRDQDRPPPPPALPPPPPPPPAPLLDRSGWVVLGEATVEGRRDRDTITVGRREGRFRRLMFVVEEGEVEVYGMTVTLGRGETFTPDVRHAFREGSRSRVIDLPGDARTIREVTFSYGNLRHHRGRARVELLAQ